MAFLSILPTMENSAYRPETEQEVEPYGPVLDIVHVEPIFILKRQVGPTGYLRHTGDTRLDREEPPMVFTVLIHFALLMGPRTDKTHLAQKYIEELR